MRNEDRVRRNPQTQEIETVLLDDGFRRTGLEHVSGPLWKNDITGNFFIVTAYDTSPISFEIVPPRNYGVHDLMKIRVRHIVEGTSRAELRMYLGRALRWIWRHFGDKRYHVMLSLVGLEPEDRRVLCDLFLSYFHQQDRASFAAVSVLWDVGGMYWVEATEDAGLPFKAELDFVGTPTSYRRAMDAARAEAA